MRRIGFVVEEPSDEKIISEIVRRLGVQPDMRVVRGKNDRKIRVFAEMLLEGGCEKVVVVKDGDCLELEDVEEERNKIRSRLGLQGVEVCVVVDEIEAWLLADEKAISNYVGSSLQEFGDPERIKKPSEELNRIFRGVGRSYLKGGEDPREVAKRLDLERLAERCRCFAEFKRLVAC